MNINRTMRESRLHSPYAVQQMRTAVEVATGNYVKHGGDHPGTKSAEDDATRRRKRKAQKESRKQARK
jgi:hypothetical protein